MARDLSCKDHPQFCKIDYNKMKLICCSSTRAQKPIFNFNVRAEEQVVTRSTSY